MKLTPLADNVLLKHMEAEEKTASGIILSTANKEKSVIAEVIAAGPGTEDVKVTVKRPNGSQYDEVTVDVTLGSSETSNTNKKSGTQSQQNQGSANDPFSQNGGSSSNGNGSNGNGSDGSQGSNGSGSSDQEQLWQQFQQFFNQYQR